MRKKVYILNVFVSVVVGVTLFSLSVLAQDQQQQKNNQEQNQRQSQENNQQVMNQGGQNGSSVSPQNSNTIFCDALGRQTTRD